MERNTIAEMREILDAIEQGKTIQCYDSCDEEWYVPVNHKHPNFAAYTYRIKPEKKWRPFNDTAELFKVYGSSVVWLRSKSTTDEACVLVMAYYPYEVSVCGYKLTMEKLMNTYTFADGTPCGVLEEDK